MCIGGPMRIEGGDGLMACAVAKAADRRPERQMPDTLIVGPQLPGTWVLAFHGAARGVLEALQARDALASAPAGRRHCGGRRRRRVGSPRAVSLIDLPIAIREISR